MKNISSIIIPCLTGLGLLLCFSLQGQETFIEVAQQTGMGVSFSSGLSIVDYDGDGRDDIFITRRNRNNQLFKNNGDGSFMDVAETAGLDFVGMSYQSIWADYDGDGDMDCYLTLGDEPDRLYQNQGDGTFTNVAASAGIAVSALPASAIWGDVNGDDLLDLFVFNIDADDVFFLNMGDGTFTDYSPTAGIAQNRLTMGGTFIDFDQDGDLDLYLSHDGEEGNFMYENDGEGHFTDVTEALSMHTKSEAMGVSVGDFNNDGWPDLFLTNRLENFLFRNNEGKSFTEIGAEAGVDDTGMGWGVSWLDFDNDGLLDLYVANDSYYSDHPNLLYRNRGDEIFEIMDSEAAIASEKGSFSTAIADLDQNGFPELLVANRGNVDRAELFVNEVENEHHWVVFRLSREAPGLPTIGAQVRVVTNLATHTRYLFSGTSWAADDSKALLFGLGAAESISKVTVRWPNGESMEYQGIDFDKSYNLSDQGNATELSYEIAPLQVEDNPGDDEIITSLEPNLSFESLKLYPNPSAGSLQLNLHTQSAGSVKIDLISPVGTTIQNLYDRNLPAGDHNLSLYLPKTGANFYLLRLSLAKQVYFRKIVRKD